MLGIGPFHGSRRIQRIILSAVCLSKLHLQQLQLVVHLGELQLEGDIFGVKLPHLCGSKTESGAAANTEPCETFAIGDRLVALGRCSGAADMVPEPADIAFESLIVSAYQDLTGPTRCVLRNGRHHSKNSHLGRISVAAISKSLIVVSLES